MADLRVTIAGVEFKNPVIMASGMFGYGREYEKMYSLSRLGGICVNGMTLKEKPGNPTPRIAESYSGVLSSTGMPNDGIDKFLSDELPNLKTKDTVIIANIAGGNIDELCKIVEKTSGSDVDMLEVNLAAPNMQKGGSAFGTCQIGVEETVKAIKPYAKKPMIIKLPPNLTQIPEMAKAAEANGADAISLIGAVPAMRFDVKIKKPLLKANFGGLTGLAVFPIAQRMVYQAAHAVKIPVIGLGGIGCWQDAAEMLIAGAKAVQIGSILFSYPYVPLNIIDGLTNYLERENIDSIEKLCASGELW